MLEPETTLGGYRIERSIGKGGMGIVYEATQLSLDRRVALKVIATDLADDDEFRERFRREGMRQAGLDHPHIVPVYEAGEAGDYLFLAMRLIRGSNLKEQAVAGTLTPKRALTLLTQVASALDAAHAAGVVHRDVKPQNILVDAAEYAYLADFGLTKGHGDRSLTRAGRQVGSLEYISPEQIRDDPATAQSDIYALAAVLYESLSGIVPYPRESDAALLYAHLQEPPRPLSLLRPELPSALDAVVSRAMAKDPSERHPTAGALMADAAEALGSRIEALSAPRAQQQQAPAPGTPVPRSSETVVDRPQRRAAETPVPVVSTPRTLPIGVVAVAAVAAAAAGAGIGVVVGRPSATAAKPPTRQTVAAGIIRLSRPAGWHRLKIDPAIPGLALDGRLSLAPTGSPDAGLAAGTTQPADPRLLPAALLKLLPKAALHGEPVRLGAVDAYRYRNLRPKGFAAALTLYVTPTSHGTATLACYGSRTLGACEDIATTLSLRRAKMLPLGPSARFASAVDAAFRTLDRKRAAARHDLARAAKPTPQRAAALRLATVYAAAAKSVARAPAGTWEAAAAKRLHGSLTAGAAAYTQLGRAVAEQDTSAFSRARTAAMAADVALQRALADLAALGYRTT